MARARLRETLQDAGGNVQAGVAARVYEADGTTPLRQTIYATESGSAVLTQPLLTDNSGGLLGWVDHPVRCVLVLTAGAANVSYGSEFVVDPFSMGLMVGGTARFDGRQSLSGSCSSGSNIITVPIGPGVSGFTASDVGKRMVVIQLTTAPDGNITDEHAVANGTISSVIDATRVTLSTNASASLAAAARVIWGTDDTLALQALLDAVQDTSSQPTGAEVRLPSGLAITTASLDFTDRHGVRLIGAGGAMAPSYPWRGTAIVCVGPGESALKVSGDFVEIVGIGLDGGGRTASIGIEHTGGWYYSQVRQVRVNGFAADGISSVNEQFSNTWTDVSALHCANGFHFAPSGTAAQKMTLNNCASEFHAGTAFILDKVENVNFYGGAAQRSVNGMLLVHGSTMVNVDGMQFEGNSTTALNIAVLDNNLGATRCTWSNCRFTGGTIASGKAIVADSALACTWSGNLFDNFPVAAGAIFSFTSTAPISHASRFNGFALDNRYQLDPALALFSSQVGVHHGLGSSALLTHSANLPISGSGGGYPFNELHWDTVVSDPDVLFDTTLHTLGFTAPRPGLYRFVFSAQWAAVGGGTVRQLSLRLNGAAVGQVTAPPSSALAIAQQVTATVLMNAGQYVEAHAFQDSGGPINILHLADCTPLFSAGQLA